jgi:hypothetical protein
MLDALDRSAPPLHNLETTANIQVLQHVKGDKILLEWRGREADKGLVEHRG